MTSPISDPRLIALVVVIPKPPLKPSSVDGGHVVDTPMRTTSPSAPTSSLGVLVSMMVLVHTVRFSTVNDNKSTNEFLCTTAGLVDPSHRTIISRLIFCIVVNS